MMSFENGVSVQLERGEMERLLCEIARNAAILLHDALEQRLADRIADRVCEK